MKQQDKSQGRRSSALRGPNGFRFRRSLGLVLLLGVLMIPVMIGSGSLQAQGSSRDWYQVDTHVHSVVSAEAQVDAGILAEASNFDYDALFITDHNNASAFQINGFTANYMEFRDDGVRWDEGSFGSLTSSTNELSTEEAYARTDSSLFLSATSDGFGETYRWTKRGPNLRAGQIDLEVAIFPTEIDDDSGAYVSVSLGGDPMVEVNNPGYTTENGVVSPGKSTILVWQIGNPRLPSSDPDQRVIVYDLGSFNMDEWNHFPIDVTAALNDIPQADRPLDYNALTHLKMAVASDDGTASAYFDGYVIQAPGQDPGVEYTNRTGFIDDFDTSTFQLFPAYEMGQQRHANRFNFAVSNPSEYFSVNFGTDGIQPTHQSGFPAKLNHPDVTVMPQQVLENEAYNADTMEVRRDSWIDVWDDILAMDLQILGDWSSDAHRGVRSGKPATYLYATDRDLESLMKAYFEGRSYLARNHFDGPVVWNLDANDSESPYPTRYPLYLSDEENAMDVHMFVGDGLNENYTITWIRNGQTIHVETIPDDTDSYEETRSVSLTEPWNYVRAEVRRSSGSSRALTQPIVFVRVPDLPEDIQYRIVDITTDNDRNYNKRFTKGIMDTNWSSASDVLHLGLMNPVDALVDLRINSDNAPQEIEIEGMTVPVASSQSQFDAATTSIWYYDSSDDLIYLKVLHTTEREDVLVEFSSTGDTTPPATPTGLTADPIHLGRIDLEWNATTDDLAVESYNLFRDPDGSLLTNLDAETLVYTDTSVLPGTTYSYRVSAVDVAGNESAQSAPASATTPGSATFTEQAVADAYVNEASPNTNYGNSSLLRADGGPTTVINSYVRFDVGDYTGDISQATLRIYGNSNSASGIDAHGVSNNNWDEGNITFNNAPSLGSVVGSSAPYSPGTWVEIDVTSFVQEDQPVTFGISTTSNTNHSLASRNSTANHPELIIQLSGGGGGGNNSTRDNNHLFLPALMR